MSDFQNNDPLIIGGVELQSRLFIGTGKYSNDALIPDVCASSGAQVTRATALKMPPKNAANVAISSALRDCPLAVSFGPSSRVAAAATVPGVPTRMAVIDPP